MNEQSTDDAKALAKALYCAYFVQGRNIGEQAVVLEVAAENGVEQDTLAAAIETDKVKAKVKTVTNNAIEAGVFGSPYFIVDGEPFWGNDRIGQLGEWLARGGW